MISRYKQVDVDDAEAGMVLHEAVLDGHGTVLLPAATELTDSMLSSLRRRGVDHVLVVDDSISEEQREAERVRVQARLDKMFRHCRNKGASDLLLQRITEYRLGSGQ